MTRPRMDIAEVLRLHAVALDDIGLAQSNDVMLRAATMISLLRRQVELYQRSEDLDETTARLEALRR